MINHFRVSNEWERKLLVNLLYNTLQQAIKTLDTLLKYVNMYS